MLAKKLALLTLAIGAVSALEVRDTKAAAGSPSLQQHKRQLPGGVGSMLKQYAPAVPAGGNAVAPQSSKAESKLASAPASVPASVPAAGAKQGLPAFGAFSGMIPGVPAKRDLPVVDGLTGALPAALPAVPAKRDLPAVGALTGALPAALPAVPSKRDLSLGGGEMKKILPVNPEVPTQRDAPDSSLDARDISTGAVQGKAKFHAKGRGKGAAHAGASFGTKGKGGFKASAKANGKGGFKANVKGHGHVNGKEESAQAAIPKQIPGVGSVKMPFGKGGKRDVSESEGSVKVVGVVPRYYRV